MTDKEIKKILDEFKSAVSKSIPGSQDIEEAVSGAIKDVLIEEFAWKGAGGFIYDGIKDGIKEVIYGDYVSPCNPILSAIEEGTRQGILDFNKKSINKNLDKRLK